MTVAVSPPPDSAKVIFAFSGGGQGGRGVRVRGKKRQLDIAAIVVDDNRARVFEGDAESSAGTEQIHGADAGFFRRRPLQRGWIRCGSPERLFNWRRRPARRAWNLHHIWKGEARRRPLRKSVSSPILT